MKNFNSSAIDSLEAELGKGGFSNRESPLYDLSDKRVLASYQKLQKTTKPEAYTRDTSSWQEIWHCAREHVSKYGDGALVIIGGAAPHIWGAIPLLEADIGTGYLSATATKLGVSSAVKALEIDKSSTFSEKSESQKEQEAVKELETQMERNLGVVKHLGYGSIEDFLAERSRRLGSQKNLIVGLEETGLHQLYNFNKVYKILEKFIAEQKPTSVLFIGEDLNVGGEGGDGSGLLQYAKSFGIPVGIGAFGHADRQCDKGTRLRGYSSPIDILSGKTETNLSKWFTPEVMTKLQLEIEKYKLAQYSQGPSGAL